MLSDYHCSTGGRGSIQSAGAEALRVRSKVVPFLLTVLSTTASNGTSTLVEISARARGAGVGT